MQIQNNVCRDLNIFFSEWKHYASLQNLMSILQNLSTYSKLSNADCQPLEDFFLFLFFSFKTWHDIHPVCLHVWTDDKLMIHFLLTMQCNIFNQHIITIFCLTAPHPVREANSKVKNPPQVLFMLCFFSALCILKHCDRLKIHCGKSSSGKKAHWHKINMAGPAFVESLFELSIMPSKFWQMLIICIPVPLQCFWKPTKPLIIHL